MCEKGLQIDPQNARLHGNLGYAYLHLGRLSESDTEFRRAVSLDPQLIPAQFGLVGVLGRQRKYLEAEAPLRHVIEIAPDNVTALCALRLVYLQLRRMPEALSLARRLYSLAPRPWLVIRLPRYAGTRASDRRRWRTGRAVGHCTSAIGYSLSSSPQLHHCHFRLDRCTVFPHRPTPSGRWYSNH